MNHCSRAKLLLSSLTLYRNLLADETVSRFLSLLLEAESGDAASFCPAYGAFLQSLAAQNAELNFSAHLDMLVRYDDNAFSRAAAAGEQVAAYPLLRKAAEHDLLAIQRVAAITVDELKQAVSAAGEDADLIAALPAYAVGQSSFFNMRSPADLVGEAEGYYHRNGYGVFAKYGAFRWNGALAGVLNPDPVRLKELKEYDYERGLVATNTLDFVEGRGGGNLLLYGDRGTGKSSTVKALANEHREKGLRIVEIPKERIADFPAVIERLRAVPLRFILFLDDLSFSADDADFSALKSVLEGGVSARPENCRVYATSNRRHLVKESFSERGADDVHAGDTMQEKLSLADRFDRTISFFAPDQARYLAIVSALAQDRGLNLLDETLSRAAVQWAIRAGGRTPRAAKQFVGWAEAQLSKDLPIYEGDE